MALAMDEVGRTIAGRYRIEAAIGDGGSAAVYRVRDTRSERVLALKRAYPGSPSKRVRRQESLEREFHTLAQLAHPSIIEVYDYGVDERGAYYTMELLDGRDLHGSGSIPWQQACALLRDVASSLALLHSRGLVHRDVSARNVRCTADGRAKLIDFGAMTSMGVAKDVVGTPPFLAPEALQMQSLDARADLYSLGALGYYMITGQHAFPARRFQDLRDAWRSRPAPTTKYQADVPNALNALLMQLLSLDRSARLNSASEVMQRLCTIAGLSRVEHTLVSRAYLTSPALLGRDTALIRMRRRMLALGRGDGGTLLIAGPSGSGRSRLLDACALEAKLVGASVLRADAGDERRDWGVARVLGSQLVQLMPEQCAAAARLSRDLLSQVIEGLRPDTSESVSTLSVDRALLIRELRDFILTLARTQRLVIVVDDGDEIDEPSTALLAALAHKTERHPIVIAISVSRDHDVGSSAPLRFLQLVSDNIELEPLVAEQTETLLRSVFGDVPYLPLVAARIHALSQGNPGAIMALAQHLADRGLARYEAGSWVLPRQLGEHDLPDSISESLSARLTACSEDAIEICEALCLADADSEALSIGTYVELSSHCDQERVLRALDELVTARILIADTQRHRFSQRGFLAVVDGRIEPPRRLRLHRKLADCLARSGGDVLRRADHLFQADAANEALSLISTLDLRVRQVPLALLLRAVEAAERLGRPKRELHQLRRALIQRAGIDLAIETYRRHAPIVQRELEDASGLSRYRELSHLPETERLQRALADVQIEYQSLAPDDRVGAVADALAGLASFCGFQRGLALACFDLALMDNLPSLAPFLPLSAALSLVELGARASRESLCGSFHRSYESYEQVLVELTRVPSQALNSGDSSRAYYGAHYVLGLLDAGRGVARAQDHITVLDQERSYQVNAWRVRMLFHLTLGEGDEAARCRRRAELIQLREGTHQQYLGTTAIGEMLVHIVCGNLSALTQAVATIALHAARFAGWKPFEVLGQGHLLRLQGDSAKALEIVHATLEGQRPGVHAAYAYLAALHVQLLCDLGNFSEASTRGRTYLSETEAADLTPIGYCVHGAVSLALASADHSDEAVGIIERAIKEAEALHHGGVSIGSMYETRARIAARMQDRETFQRYSELCAAAYQNGKDSHLAARLARLHEEARMGSIEHVDSSLPHRSIASDPATSSEYATLHSRMLECVDEGDRARTALTLLLQSLDSFAGYLYGVNETDHVLLASLPEDDYDAELAEWFAELLASEREPVQSEDPNAAKRFKPSGPGFRYKDPQGRHFEPLFLIRHEENVQRLAAVLVFHVSRDAKRRPMRELQEELAEQLLLHADVTGTELKATNTQTRTR